MLPTNERTRFKFWSLAVCVSVFGAALSFMTTNYKLDIYGLFGDQKGRKLTVLVNERMTKYLLSFKYIPQNFDSLLVGTSISDNWNTALIQCCRVYNASIAGGNISEERLVVDRVLRTRKLRLAVFIVYPYLTASFGRKNASMSSQDYWGALGSILLIRSYWMCWKIRSGRARQEFSDFGVNDFYRPPWPQGPAPRTPEPTRFDIDPRALREYGNLVQEVRNAGTCIVAVIPPIEHDDWLQEQKGYKDYLAEVLPLFQPADTIIDFNQPAFLSLTGDKSNFTDGVHLSRKAADFVVSVISARSSELTARDARAPQEVSPRRVPGQ